MSQTTSNQTSNPISSPSTLAELHGSYTIDPAHSLIGFVARHAMVTKVRGSFDDVDGSFAIDGGRMETATASVTIRTASIDTRNSQRDEHLRTGDFLAADQFPTITFVSTGVVATGPASLELTGNLTIKEVTRSVTVPFDFEGGATDPFGNARVGFEGAVQINRTDYGITWNAALETGGVLVSDKITLEFEISAIKS